MKPSINWKQEPPHLPNHLVIRCLGFFKDQIFQPWSFHHERQLSEAKTWWAQSLEWVEALGARPCRRIPWLRGQKEKMGPLGDRRMMMMMMMMTDKMISDWCQSCDEIQMFAVNLLFSSLNFPTAWDRWCFRFVFPTITTTCQPQLFLGNHRFCIKLNYMAKCQKNGLVKGILWTASPVRSSVRCLRIQSSSHASIVHWALRLDEGCRSISALSSYEKKWRNLSFLGDRFFGIFWDSNGFKTSLNNPWVWKVVSMGCFQILYTFGKWLVQITISYHFHPSTFNERGLLGTPKSRNPFVRVELRIFNKDPCCEKSPLFLGIFSDRHISLETIWKQS